MISNVPTRIIGRISALLTVALLTGCAAQTVKQQYLDSTHAEQQRHEQAMATIESSINEKLADLSSLELSAAMAETIVTCQQDTACKQAYYQRFIQALKVRYSEADFDQVLRLCHQSCQTPRQLEYIVALGHNATLTQQITMAKADEDRKHQNLIDRLNTDFQRDYAIALAQDRRAAMAFAAGLAAYGQAMQQQQAAYQQPYSSPQPATYPSGFTTQPVTLPRFGGGPCPYAPNCLNNPYGAGSPYKADGLMNPYSRYGSRYSNQSWTNPYATDAPKLYDQHGNYLGKFSSNRYDPDSISNPYGRFGNPYSPRSINNPYGAGNPFSASPIYVVPSP